MSNQMHKEPREDTAKKRPSFTAIVAARLVHVIFVLVVAWIGIKWLSGLPYLEQAKGLAKLFGVLGFAAVVPEMWIRHLVKRP